ncbi:hypothetical protein [Oribacterium sp. FC2011]|nr:hypothetical protein [Oribacterium sp. FC2011]
MIITVLLGSPNKKGSTSILVDEFKRGAEESYGARVFGRKAK